MTFALDVWRNAEWVTVATFASKADAKTRAFELRLPVWRVREVGLASYERV